MSDPKSDETFRVIDRRLFNTDGEIRDEAARAERAQQESERPAADSKAKPPSPAGSASSESAAPAAAAPAPELETPAADEPKSSRGLELLINFVAQNAAMLLGAYPDPRTGQAVLDLDGARELIDMLDALQETTRGNLSRDDERLLLEVLGSLKLSFMEMTKAAAKAMKEKAKTPA